ncbi:hypothetical protein MMC25_007883 [Agyrium rufum]|nr:hypothetical protein [Agyrium rufum]
MASPKSHRFSLSYPLARIQTISFLQLPAEIRNKIYESALTSPEEVIRLVGIEGLPELSSLATTKQLVAAPIYSPNYPWSPFTFNIALLRTCKQINDEASSFIYSRHCFEFIHGLEVVTAFLTNLRASIRSLLKKVSFRTGAGLVLNAGFWDDFGDQISIQLEKLACVRDVLGGHTQGFPLDCLTVELRGMPELPQDNLYFATHQQTGLCETDIVIALQRLFGMKFARTISFTDPLNHSALELDNHFNALQYYVEVALRTPVEMKKTAVTRFEGMKLHLDVRAADASASKFQDCDGWVIIDIDNINATSVH